MLIAKWKNKASTREATQSAYESITLAQERLDAARTEHVAEDVADLLADAATHIASATVAIEDAFRGIDS